MAPTSASGGSAARAALGRTGELVAGDADSIARDVAERLRRKILEASIAPPSLAEAQRRFVALAETIGG